jgi:hypothetical protein
MDVEDLSLTELKRHVLELSQKNKALLAESAQSLALAARTATEAPGESQGTTPVSQTGARRSHSAWPG